MHVSSGLSKLIVGGITWSRSDKRVKMDSIAPAAPNKCQVIDLVELTNKFVFLLNTETTACASVKSPAGADAPMSVDVTHVTRCNTPHHKALIIVSAAPLPFSGGDVIW